MTAIEKTRDFKGVYHVLMGALSPLQGIGPDELKIKSLLARVGEGQRRGDHSRDQSERRRRGDGALSGAPAEAARRPGHADRDGRSGRQRSRICRRGDHAQGDGRTQRSIVVPTTIDSDVLSVSTPISLLVLGGAIAWAAGLSAVQARADALRVLHRRACGDRRARSERSNAADFCGRSAAAPSAR